MMGEKIMKKELMLIDKNKVKLLIEDYEKRLQDFQNQIEKYTKKAHYLNGAITAWKIVLEKEEKDEEKELLIEIDRMIPKTMEKIGELMKKSGNQNEILQLLGFKSALLTIKNMLNPLVLPSPSGGCFCVW